MKPKSPLHGERSRSKHFLRLTGLEQAFKDDIGSEFGMKQCCFGCCRSLRVDHDLQRLVLDVNERHRVFGNVAAFRNDDRNRLANIANLVDRQRRIGRRMVVRHSRRGDDGCDLAEVCNR